jgi:hypothetical protein
MSDLDPTTGRPAAADKRTHFRMATDFFTNHKLDDITDPIERIAVRGLLGHSIAVAREAGSDGHVVAERVVADLALPPEMGKVLIAEGSWHQADHGCLRCPEPRAGHVYVHDFLGHNHTSEWERRLRERRRANGAAGGTNRWAEHAAPDKPKRAPGRPRTRPQPEAPAVAQVELIPPREGEQVGVHPAEELARRRGRPRRTAPREYAPEVHALCEKLADHIQQNDPDHKRPTYGERWLNACRLMIEKDDRAPDKIAKAIDWCQNDAFWSGNILSMPTLREKYRTLQGHAQRGRGVPPPRRGGPPAAVSVPGMNALYDDDVSDVTGNGVSLHGN